MYRYLISEAQLSRLRDIVNAADFTAEQLEAQRILDSLPLIRGGYNKVEIRPDPNRWPVEVTAGHISGGLYPSHDHIINDLKHALILALNDWWPLVYDRTCRDTVRSQAGWFIELVQRSPAVPVERKFTITADMVKLLRQQTGEGLMGCKRALFECNGDMVKATEYLRNMGNIGAELRALTATQAPHKEFIRHRLGELAVVCTGAGKSVVCDEVDPWILCSDCLPADHTPVLIKYKGKIRVGELAWDAGSVEECYKPYRYWDCPYNDGQDWEWDDVTHWMLLPKD